MPKEEPKIIVKGITFEEIPNKSLEEIEKEVLELRNQEIEQENERFRQKLKENKEQEQVEE